MEPRKITQEELKEITDLRDNFAAVFQNIGVVQIRIKDLEIENDKNYTILSELRKKEEDVFNRLKTNYGEGTLDLTTGQINYNS
jgi:predicted nuclease with TOPRIM domain